MKKVFATNSTCSSVKISITTHVLGKSSIIGYCRAVAKAKYDLKRGRIAYMRYKLRYRASLLQVITVVYPAYVSRTVEGRYKILKQSDMKFLAFASSFAELCLVFALNKVRFRFCQKATRAQ